MKRPKIVVVGSVNVDLVTRAPRMPHPGETLRGTAFTMTLGGKGTNQAIAAARLGADVSLIGCVGTDAFGAYARGEMAKEQGLSLTGLAEIAGTSTGVAVIAIDSAGQNAITIVGAANDALTPALIEQHRALIESADVLMIQGEVPAAANIAAATIMRANGGIVVFDPAPVGQDGFPPELMRLATVITPNESETHELTGHAVDSAESAVSAGRRLLSDGNSAVVIKMGSAGAMHVTASGAVKIPAFSVKVVDTVAAGDSFNAGLAVGLAEKPADRIDWAAALRLAAATGALATTRQGASAAAPHRAEVEVLLRG